MDERSLQLLKAMREQLGETTGRTVDAVAAASSLGMYPGTLDRSLLYLVRAGYLVHDQATSWGMERCS